MSLYGKKSMLISELKKRRSICWYPSAGSDFRPLLYLSKPFYDKHKELSDDKDVFPDLFIMTDYQESEYTGYSDVYHYDYMRKYYPNDFDKISKGTLRRGDILYRDHRTSITVKDVIKIVIDGMEVKKELVTSGIPEWYGQGYCITVEVNSFNIPDQKLGKWDMDIVYLYAENTAFAKHILIQNQINVDFIVSVRYGGNFGGSTNFGGWLFYIADTLDVKYYISPPIDHIPDYQNADVMEYLKEDAEIIFERPRLTPLYEKEWHENEIVNWYRVER
ncbi:MAG: hypothetical protein J1E40_02015 [Oscillospiraceae bacterium]|nr:hypothetical protein [Oscillospiraceae bacterium]